MAVRKCSVAFLPIEFAFDSVIVINEICGVVLYISDEIGKCHRRFKPYEDMNMVFHPVDDDGLLSLVFDNSRHVFENLLPPFLGKQVLPSLHSKYDLNIDLRISTRHVSSKMVHVFNPEGMK